MMTTRATDSRPNRAPYIATRTRAAMMAVIGVRDKYSFITMANKCTLVPTNRMYTGKYTHVMTCETRLSTVLLTHRIYSNYTSVYKLFTRSLIVIHTRLIV